MNHPQNPGANSSKQLKSLIYLDPPYYVQGRELYMSSYQERDHKTVADYVRANLETPWMVSYDDVPEVRRIYKKTRSRSSSRLISG